MGDKMYHILNIKGIIALVMVLFLSCENSSYGIDGEMSRFTPSFNAEEAFVMVQKQVQLGPRVPGTKAHHLCRKFIQRTLTESGYTTSEQMGLVDSDQGILEIYNIQASYKPDLEERVLICGHYDSRRTADMDHLNPDQPVPGANDGASGTAVMLEIASAIRTYDLNIGVDFIFFDGDDQGVYPVV
jgi:hypothetical protein